MGLQVLRLLLNGKPISHLEKKLEFSNGSISKWERTSPSIDKVKKVADYFNVSTDYLLTGKEPLPPDVTAAEMELLKKLRALSPEKRQTVETLLNQL